MSRARHGSAAPARFAAAALVVAVLLGALLSPFASSAPDGLARVAQDQGFAGHERLHVWQGSSPLAGYALPGVAGARPATALAGLSGTLLAFVVAGGGAWLLRARSSRPGG